MIGVDTTFYYIPFRFTSLLIHLYETLLQLLNKFNLAMLF